MHLNAPSMLCSEQHQLNPPTIWFKIQATSRKSVPHPIKNWLISALAILLLLLPIKTRILSDIIKLSLISLSFLWDGQSSQKK